MNREIKSTYHPELFIQSQIQDGLLFQEPSDCSSVPQNLNIFNPVEQRYDSMQFVNHEYSDSSQSGKLGYQLHTTIFIKQICSSYRSKNKISTLIFTKFNNSIFVEDFQLDTNEEFKDYEPSVDNESPENGEQPTIQASSHELNQNRFNQILLDLNHDINYSPTVFKQIKKHKEWRNKLPEKEQSRDLYRNDNLRKKTWRCLRQIIIQHTNELKQSLPARFRKEPISIHAKIKSFLRPYDLAQDYETYYTLVACILFLSMRRTYAKFIQMLPLEPEVQNMMINKAEEFKEINDNKTSRIKWSSILGHPLFGLAKSLFYKDRQSQDVFFIKALG